MIEAPGILLIIKPVFKEFNLAMILPIFCAATYSLSMIFAKLTSESDTVFQQTTHIYISNFILAAITSILAINYFPSPEAGGGIAFLLRPFDFENHLFLIYIIIISIFGTAGILCLVTAYRIGSPSTNSPCEYIFLIYVLIFGYFLFDEIPDVISVLGMLLIVLSGTYIFIREGIRNSEVATTTSLR